MRAGEAEINAAAEKAAAAFAAAGFPKMPARALMALVSSEDGSLTAAELAGKLGVSAAAVSGAVRYLQTVGFVHRVSQPGSRRDLYALYDDEWYVVSMRKSPIYQSLAALTDATAEALPAGSAARSRVTEMGSFYRFLAARMPAVLDDWERQRAGDSGEALSPEVLSGEALSNETLSKGGAA
ncbi:GbsR/MarR family transcriptional regulator [Arthrobacter sp. HS15c]|uniref:GbsR/MarR family transcriptional regulator n=1 Tax=Arthrobacter sp. HS15c TaxID=3230279 RepID=UPI0034669961